MLTDPKLKSQVDQLWDKFWTGGLTNPLDAIEQFSYLLFLKRLDDGENAARAPGQAPGQAYTAQHASEMRWGYWTKLKADAGAEAPQRSDLPLVPHAGRERQLVRALHEERRVQDQQAQPADRGLQADRPDADLASRTRTCRATCTSTC